MKSFIESQFKYCPLVWMFHSRELNNKINNLHERALRIVYKDNKSTFNEFLTKDNSVSIRYHNLQTLATKMFKGKHNLSPEIVINMFSKKEVCYNSEHIQNSFCQM